MFLGLGKNNQIFNIHTTSVKHDRTSNPLHRLLTAITFELIALAPNNLFQSAVLETYSTLNIQGSKENVIIMIMEQSTPDSQAQATKIEVHLENHNTHSHSSEYNVMNEDGSNVKLCEASSAIHKVPSIEVEYVSQNNDDDDDGSCKSDCTGIAQDVLIPEVDKPSSSLLVDVPIPVPLHVHVQDANASKDDASISANESVPSQTGTDITGDDEFSLDSIDSGPDADAEKEEVQIPDGPLSPRMDDTIADKSVIADPSEAIDPNETSASEPTFTTGTQNEQNDQNEVPTESEDQNKVGLEIDVDIQCDTNDSVVSAIEINDSFSEIASFKSITEVIPDDDDDDNNKGPPSKRSRRVNFREEIVTDMVEISRWTPEEKSYLFYTGREMHQFRIEYIMEMRESVEYNYDEWTGYQRGGIRLFLSMYTALVELFACRAVVQFCCGGNPDDNTSANQYEV